ncbi:DUF2642 domain-containing protein [Peribacillus frigoritolerans]|uniref:DUF2642 domain-containing protein n=1 Tax=Peribacillus frigoritolerans TaxID=450367 RepID=UPI0035163A7D
MKKHYFQETLDSLIGFKISIISDDKTVHDGLVLDVKSDFIVIQMNPDKQCYFNLNQVYALSKNTKEFHAQILDHEPTQKQSFTELINELKGHWVTINRENNLSLDGFLSTVTNDYIVLLNKDKQLYIQLSNILYIFKGIDNKESSENKQQENKDGKTENKQSESDQVKESDSVLKEDTEVNSKGKEEPVEQKQEQDAQPEVISEAKEEPAFAQPEVISEAKEEPAFAQPEVISEAKEEPAFVQPEVISEAEEEPAFAQPEVISEAKEEPAFVQPEVISEAEEEPAFAQPEVISEAKEEPTVQSTVNEVGKDQSNVKESTDKYKRQKSPKKKKKESKKEKSSGSKKEKSSESNKKDLQEAIQENLTEEFRNSVPLEMSEQSVKKNHLKEKRKLIDKKCYELMKSTEKIYTENGNQKNEYYSLMKFAERMHGKLKAKRSKP